MSGGDEERLIVLLEGRISQFEKAMQAAEKRGTSTYNGLVRDSAKATAGVERNILTMAETQSRALEGTYGKFAKNAQQSSSVFERAINKSQSQVDALRASIDPLFAASKRYEAAVEQLNAAERVGVLTATQKAQIMERLGSEYLGAAATTQRLGAVSSETRMRIQQVGWQVQDTAVQIAAGTSPMQALSMQLPQLASAFGTVGIAIGTLAAVGIPLLGAAFASVSSEAKSVDDALEALENSVRAVNDVAAIYTAEGLQGLIDKYGDVTTEVLALVEAQRQLAIVSAENGVRDTFAALREEIDGWQDNLWLGLFNMFDHSTEAATRLVELFDELDKASGLDGQLVALSRLRIELETASGGVENMSAAQRKFYEQVVESEDAMRELAASAPRADWLSAAIDGAAELASNFWEAARARAAALAEDPPATGRQDPRNFGGSAEDIQTYSPAAQLAYGNDYTPPRSSGGRRRGGGGGRGRGESPLDTLLADLETEREIVAAWYQEALDTINTATDAQLGAVGGRHEALERLEQEHQERLRGIRDEADGSAIANAETLFGALATISAAGGDKMVKAARIFGAAEALINTYRAQAAVLANQPGGLFSRLAAYAAIGAAGLRVVTAIRGGSSGGGSVSASGSASSSASVSAASTEAAVPLMVSLEPIDPNALFTGAQLRALYERLFKEAGSRGITGYGGQG